MKGCGHWATRTPSPTDQTVSSPGTLSHVQVATTTYSPPPREFTTDLDSRLILGGPLAESLNIFNTCSLEAFPKAV